MLQAFLRHDVRIVVFAVAMIAAALVVGASTVDDPKPQQSQEPPPSTTTAVDPDEDELLAEPEENDLLTESSGDDLLLAPEPAASDDDLLLGEEPPAVSTDAEAAVATTSSADAHQDIFLEDRYPSANTCATCHPTQYREWSVSQHAYAQLSPMMMAMQNFINLATSTTNGDFCLRCHSRMGSELNEPFSMSNLDRHPASREGITCISCHRVSQAYGKFSGRLSIDKGDLFSPVMGPEGGEELQRVLSKPETYRVVTSPDQPGRGIHTEAKRFFQLTTPGFCGTCHDVNLPAGFRLEEAFSEYKHSPAAKRGATCQDCHMGKVQGRDEGYDEGPAAIVGGVPTMTRRLTSHYFAGPDYPIVHPGIFPHNVKAAEFKTLREWVQFDWRAGWGTDEFEDSVSDDYAFPEAWQYIDDRYDARAILDEQFELLAWAREKRLEVLRNGFGLTEIKVDRSDDRGLAFEVGIKNKTDGHPAPTGFDAERLIFLEVTVADANGNVVYRSGDRDPNGDVRDLHSRYVVAGLLPIDKNLLSLQSKTIVRLNRGGDREQVLPLNQSVSAIPFVRPDTRATSIYGRPKGARKQRMGLAPLTTRMARHEIDASMLKGEGPYSIDVRLWSQAVPVNLVAEVEAVGFDYGMSPREVADRLVEGAEMIEEKSTSVTLRGTSRAATVTAASSEATR